MEKIGSFVKAHPVQTALMAGAAVVVLYFVLGGGGSSSSSGSNQEAALQNAYFQAEGLQAQSGAAIQVANINASAATDQAQIAATTSVANNTTWANTDLGITESNNQSATAALPYATEDNLISALSGIASQTQTTTTQKKSSGFFGIGGGSSAITTTAPTTAALNAANYLSELSNGNFAMNG